MTFIDQLSLVVSVYTYLPTVLGVHCVPVTYYSNEWCVWFLFP